MSATSGSDVITAAMSIAKDVAEGKLDPGGLDRQLVAEMREAFGTVVGEGDPAWGLQVEVARAVLAAGGLPAGELGEWAAVARRRDSGAD